MLLILLQHKEAGEGLTGSKGIYLTTCLTNTDVYIQLSYMETQLLL